MWSMTVRKKLNAIIGQWPMALLVFGGMLTFIWLAVLIWLPFRLISVM